MYKILTYKNGQPVILYRQESNVTLYTIDRGRVYSKGTIFDNVKTDFQIFPNNSVFYISTHNKIVLANLIENRFVIILSMSMVARDHSTAITNVVPIFLNNEVYIFYTIENKEVNSQSIYYINTKTPNKSVLIKANIDIRTSIEFVYSKAHVILISKNNDDISVYYFDCEKKISCLFDTKNNNNCSLNKIEIEKYKKELLNCSEALKEKDAQINQLTSANKELSNQYNDLAQFAGKLQDELRKYRYIN